LNASNNIKLATFRSLRMKCSAMRNRTTAN